jgi:hypothetical protein
MMPPGGLAESASIRGSAMIFAFQLNIGAASVMLVFAQPIQRPA